MSQYRAYFVPGSVDPWGLKKWKTKVVAKSFIADIDKFGLVRHSVVSMFPEQISRSIFRTRVIGFAVKRAIGRLT